MKYYFPFLTAFVVGLLYSVDCISGTFDCRRQGQNLCPSESPCNTDGTCECKPGWTGYKCDIQNATVDAQACTPQCEGGLCASDGTTHKCYCRAQYLDDSTCSKQRYKVSCNSTSMSINIVPIGSFQGIVYVVGHADTCEFENAATQSWVSAEYNSGKARVISHNDDNCGNAVSTTENGVVKISRQIYVQYNNLFESSIDEVVEAKCTFDTKTETITFESVFNSVRPASSNEAQSGVRVSAENDLNPLRLKITKDGTQMTKTTPVRLGDVITLELKAFPESEFEDFLIRELTVDNNMKDNELRHVYIIKDGCPEKTDEAAIMTEGTSVGSALTRIFTFTVIKFTNSQDVRIKFTATLCKKGDTTGCKVTCAQRRRREAPSTQTQSIEVVMKIWNNAEEKPTTTVQETHIPVDSENETVERSKFFGLSDGILAGVITLSVVIVVVIVVVVMLACHVLRKKREKERF